MVEGPSAQLRMVPQGLQGGMSVGQRCGQLMHALLKGHRRLRQGRPRVSDRRPRRIGEVGGGRNALGEVCGSVACWGRRWSHVGGSAAGEGGSRACERHFMAHPSGESDLNAGNPARHGGRHGPGWPPPEATRTGRGGSPVHGVGRCCGPDAGHVLKACVVARHGWSTSTRDRNLSHTTVPPNPDRAVSLFMSTHH